jgi:hypothetical protein
VHTQLPCGTNVYCSCAASHQTLPLTPRALLPLLSQFIAGGCEVSLIVAIDFTGSNGDPDMPNSLHFMSATGNSVPSCVDIRAVKDRPARVCLTRCGVPQATWMHFLLLPGFGVLAASTK